MRNKLLKFFVFSSCCQLVIGQTGELRSVEEVIQGIDELLGEYDQGFEPMDTGPVNPLFFPKFNSFFGATQSIRTSEFL